MPPKKKIPRGTSSKKELETENEYLELADEHEQAAKKWKAGDIKKSVRFFQRALDAYSEGLAKFPKSFDLAYNAAVLQYELTQDARISAAMTQVLSRNPKLTRAELLNKALQSHRYALSLREENIDILFNTAQVLTSAAELLSAERDDESKKKALKMLEEAAELFSSCLSRQELEFTQNHETQTEAHAVQGDVVDMEVDMQQAGISVADQGPQWATIVEPVTPNDLIDTAIAMLSTLTTCIDMSAALNPENYDYSSHTSAAYPLIKKLPSYIALLPEIVPVAEETPAVRFLSVTTGSIEVEKPTAPSKPRQEATQAAELARARFECALRHFDFQKKLYGIDSYYHSVVDEFKDLLAGDQTPVQVSIAYIEELVDYAMNIRDTLIQQTSGAVSRKTIMERYWETLSHAQDLTLAVLKDLEAGRNLQFRGHEPLSKSSIFELSGDIALRQHWITVADDADAEWKRTNDTNLQRAMYSYRQATAHAIAAGDKALGKKCRIKEIAVRILREALDHKPDTALNLFQDMDPELVCDVIEEMAQEDELLDKTEYDVIKKHAGNWLYRYTGDSDSSMSDT